MREKEKEKEVMLMITMTRSGNLEPTGIFESVTGCEVKYSHTSFINEIFKDWIDVTRKIEAFYYSFKKASREGDGFPSFTLSLYDTKSERVFYYTVSKMYNSGFYSVLKDSNKITVKESEMFDIARLTELVFYTIADCIN